MKPGAQRGAGHPFFLPPPWRGRVGVGGSCALTCVVLGVLAAACTVGATVAPGPLPSPPPAQAPVALATPDTSCGDPTASLRPQGPRPAPGAMPAGSFMRMIQDRGQVIAGVSRDTPHFGSLDPVSNQLAGFDIDLVKQLSKAIFGDESHVRYRVLGEAEAIPALQAGTVDVVARTLTITCDRWRQVAFSTEYYHAEQRLLVARNSPVQGLGDLRARKVCATATSTSLAYVGAARSHPVPVGNWEECLVLFQLGEVDAISADDAILLGLTEQDPNARIVGDPISDAPYGLAVATQHPELVRFVNSVLEQMRADGRWSALRSRWLGPLGSPGAAPPAARYRD
jgi:polar amino acid transport system substrate-binding protein